MHGIRCKNGNDFLRLKIAIAHAFNFYNIFTSQSCNDMHLFVSICCKFSFVACGGLSVFLIHRIGWYTLKLY